MLAIIHPSARLVLRVSRLRVWPYTLNFGDVEGVKDLQNLCTSTPQPPPHVE